MDVQQVLRIPEDELVFLYPDDFPKDQHDWRYGTLRSDLGCEGLRYWRSFEENPTYIRKFMKLATIAPVDWRPIIYGWDRVVTSELSLADFYKKTLFQRVNIGLETAYPGLHLVGTARRFPSYGTYDNRLEGDSEKLIGSDYMVFDGDFTQPPDLQNLGSHIVCIGDLKRKYVGIDQDESRFLPGTIGCCESWLAQPVQCCLDLNISMGFVLTNLELVIFHLSKSPSYSNRTNVMTLRSRNIPSRLDALPSDATQETEFSSPIVRKTDDWDSFHKGDDEIPDVGRKSLVEKKWATPTKAPQAILEAPRTPPRGSLPSTPLTRRKRPRTSNLQGYLDKQARLQEPTTPTPDARAEHDDGIIGDLPFSPQHETTSPSEFEVDHRSEDPGYILVRSYRVVNNGELAMRLFEHILLAYRAKRAGLKEMGYFKHSHSALDALEAE